MSKQQPVFAACSSFLQWLPGATSSGCFLELLPEPSSHAAFFQSSNSFLQLLPAATSSGCFLELRFRRRLPTSTSSSSFLQQLPAAASCNCFLKLIPAATFLLLIKQQFLRFLPLKQHQEK
ncbi:hypothetical protein CHARACLAT_032551 [Characodon lateralis]|uniref:Uncharacterized protein n=1 Tax=Characodon lateralis TaxID=208331 RepID=A0ABU7D5D6_9TELE|nr:hypothetical protein [Characodon lateralis]